MTSTIDDEVSIPSNWHACAALIEADPTILPRKVTDMGYAAPRRTRQDQAFERMMTMGKCPPTDTQLATVRLDSEEEMLRFINKHQFISQVTDYGMGTYEVEYFA